MVLSALDLRRTLLKLLPPDVLSDSERAKVRKFRQHDGASLKFNAALNRLPQFTAWEGPGSPHTGEVEIAPSMEYLERAYDAGKIRAVFRPTVHGHSVPERRRPIGGAARQAHHDVFCPVPLPL